MASGGSGTDRLYPENIRIMIEDHRCLSGNMSRDQQREYKNVTSFLRMLTGYILLKNERSI